MTEYKLQTDITYYITSDHGVFFIEPSRKLLTNKASLWLFKTGHKVAKSGTIRTGQEFEIELRENEIWVRHPKLMGGTDYFRVLDQSENNLLEIVQNIDIINHKPNAKFELLTLESEAASVGYHPYLSCPGMRSYEAAWDEFVRTTNIQRKPRTKKIIPGHRYDTPGFTLWCLGLFNGLPGFVASKGNATKISEILTGLNRAVVISRPTSIKYYCKYESSDLLLLEHPGLMTDSGQDLEADWSDPIYKFWDSWIPSKSLSLRDWSTLYNLLGLTCPGGLKGWSSEEPSIKTKLEKILKDSFLHVFIEYEGYQNSSGISLSSTSPNDKDLCKNVKDLYIYMWPGHRQAAEDSLDFLSSLGIDVDKAVFEAKSDFNKIDFGTFENFLKYKRVLKWDKKTYERSLTFKESQKDDGGQIRSLFSNQSLSNTVVEMLKLAQENLGLVSDLFSYLGVYQYSRHIVPELNIKLTLNNIIDYMGGIDTLTEPFKESLMCEKFLVLNITLSRNLTIL